MASDCLEGEKSVKLTHKQRRQLLKKEKRRQQRIALAKEREADQAEDLDAKIKEYGSLEKYQEMEIAMEKQEEEEKARLHQQWLKKEEKFRKEYQAKQDLIRRIQEEEKQRGSSSSDSDVEDQNQDNKPFHNPLAPLTTNDQFNKGEGAIVESKQCPFFKKTGVCRFGDRCSRVHVNPEVSCVLLIPNMFTSIGLSEGLQDEQEFDTNLEYSENDLQSQFIEFYNDIYPEFQVAGEIKEFKICCNYEPHLRGNVYVEYKSEDDCRKAFQLFHGRWYAQRQLFCQFSPVSNWKSAVCGLYRQKRCPKGKHCNFLHVFENPIEKPIKTEMNDRHRESRRYRSSRDYNKAANRSRHSDSRHYERGSRYDRRHHSHSSSRLDRRSRDNDNSRREKRSKRSRSPVDDSKKRRKKHKHRSSDSSNKDNDHHTKTSRSERRDEKSRRKGKNTSVGSYSE